MPPGFEFTRYVEELIMRYDNDHSDDYDGDIYDVDTDRDDCGDNDNFDDNDDYDVNIIII
uniref:Uncharacterized protein n=1 Tax=Setaria digitata TaxID=48799 RepID=A0A915PCQ0_9BILA